MTEPATARRRHSERSMVGRDPWRMPLEEIDLAHPGIWKTGEYLPFLARLRRDAPVHFCASSAVGPYWSVTRYHDIMAVEADTATFSSEPTIGIVDVIPEYTLPMFIAMDPPRHDEQRKVVQGAVAPANLKNLEGLIRGRVSTILDSLPPDRSFNWVDLVSRELTTQMLATLFDFPFEERRKLTRWSDVATGRPARWWSRKSSGARSCWSVWITSAGCSRSARAGRATTCSPCSPTARRRGR